MSGANPMGVCRPGCTQCMLNLCVCVCVCVCVRARARACAGMCSVVSDFQDPMNCSPAGFSVRGITQARTLEWVAISYSKGSSQPRDQTCVFCVSCIGRKILQHCATWEACLLRIFIRINNELLLYQLKYLRGIQKGMQAYIMTHWYKVNSSGDSTQIQKHNWTGTSEALRRPPLGHCPVR